MIDVQHDSPVPIHEQIAQQLMVHIAAGDLKAGTRLVEHRLLAQQLLTNPQPVARAYSELEHDGVLKRHAGGEVEVTHGAAVVCRTRLQEKARHRIFEAVSQARVWGLPAAEIHKSVEAGLSSAPPLSSNELQTAIKISSHGSTSDRASQGVQVLSRQEGRGSTQPEDS